MDLLYVCSFLNSLNKAHILRNIYPLSITSQLVMELGVKLGYWLGILSPIDKRILE